jgi:PAS domain S-box-containing protein
MLDNDSHNTSKTNDTHRDVVDLARLLQESEDRNKLIIEQSPIAIEVYDTDGKLIHINSACIKMFGIKSLDDVKGFSLFDDPNISSDHKKKLNMAEPVRYESVFDFDLVTKLNLYHTKKSGQIWLDSQITPTVDNNKVIGYMLHIQDITDRKIKELKIAEDEQRFRSYFNNSSLGIAITSPEKGWLDVNSKLCSLLCYNKDEITKTTWAELTHPDDIKADEKLFDQLLSGKINSYSLDKRFIRKDKSIIWTQISISCARNDDNSLKYAIAIIEDISNRKILQDSIESKDKALATILQISTEININYTDNINYLKITDAILDISGATYATFNLFDDNGRQFTTKSISGINDGLLKIPKILGFDITEKKWDYDPIREKKLAGKSVTIFNHLFDLAGDVIPHKISFTIEKIFNLGEIVVVKVSKDNYSIGDFTLLFSGDKKLKNQGLVELLANQVGLYIYRKKISDNLILATQRLTLATRASNIGIWDYDVINNKLIWDKQMYSLYGITADTFSGAYESWQAGLHPDDVERGDAEFQMALRGEKEFNTEFRVLWPDKSVHYIRALATVQRDKAQKPLRMIGTNWDITEQKNNDYKMRIRLQDTESINKLMTGRELKMIELKEEITRLKKLND